MSSLSAKEIRSRLTRTGPDRLVIAPILEPDEQLRDSQASIDVRLGSHFYIAQATSEDVVDTVESPRRVLSKLGTFVPVGDFIVLHPHQFLLGETLEFIRMPTDLMAYVVGRSSWGREGLIVATAVGIHPGYTGIVTLELRNLGEVPIRLYPASLIAQLFIHDVRGAAPTVSGHSQFSGSTGPSPGAHTSRATLDKLRKLKRPRQP